MTKHASRCQAFVTNTTEAPPGDGTIDPCRHCHASGRGRRHCHASGMGTTSLPRVWSGGVNIQTTPRPRPARQSDPAQPESDPAQRQSDRARRQSDPARPQSEQTPADHSLTPRAAVVRLPLEKRPDQATVRPDRALPRVATYSLGQSIGSGRLKYAVVRRSQGYRERVTVTNRVSLFHYI